MLAVRTLGSRPSRVYYTKPHHCLTFDQMTKSILKETPPAESWALGL